MKRLIGMLLVLGCGSRGDAVTTLEDQGAKSQRDEKGNVTAVNLDCSEITDTGWSISRSYCVE